MIFTQQTNVNPMSLKGMAIKLSSNTANVNPVKYTTNCCFSCGCKPCFPVWGGGAFDWQNDKSTFAFVKVLSTDTFAFSLWKDGVKQVDITDNTFGDYVASYGDNPKQHSFVLDWDKVFTTYGAGEYTFKNIFTSLGNTSTFESDKFCLSQFDECSVNDWIKIDWIQEGDILRDNFKFSTPLFHSFKFRSFLEIQAPTTIKDVYQTSDREEEMFRIEQRNSYLLNIKLIRENLLSLINENMVLANKLTVTDFNATGTGFIEKDLSFVEFANLEDFQGVKKFDCQLKLVEYKQDIIKTNC